MNEPQAPAPQNLFTVPGDAVIPALTSPWSWAVLLMGVLALGLMLLTGSNQPLFEFINRRLPVPGAVWSSLTILGDTVVALSLVLPFCGRRADIVRGVFVAALIATLLVHSIKPLVGELRPAAMLASDMITIIGPELKRSSFPSGHTTTIFTVFGVFVLLNAKRLYMLGLLLLALLVGVSRAGVGAHWPVDVAAGMTIGWLSALLGVHLARHWRGGLSLMAQRIFALIFLLCVLSLLFFHDTEYPQALPLQYLIGIASLALAAPSLWRLVRGQ